MTVFSAKSRLSFWPHLPVKLWHLESTDVLEQTLRSFPAPAAACSCNMYRCSLNDDDGLLRPDLMRTLTAGIAPSRI